MSTTPSLAAHPSRASRGHTTLTIVEPEPSSPFHNAAVELANQHEALKREFFKLLADRMLQEDEIRRIRIENASLRNALGGKKPFVFLE